MTPRAIALQRLREESRWDLVVIGGGATGLGAALDAVARGYRAALLEAGDFAQGTSSRSTKLIHGGVRYLARGDIGLVREALRERGLLLRNAPHLVHSRAFIVPAHRIGERTYYATGLWLYDRLAGTLGLERSRALGRDACLERVPNLAREGLRGGVEYHDGQFDDARLAIALARTIDDRGGVVLNGMEVRGIEHDAAGRVSGVRARDVETGEELVVPARGVINATGVFVDGVRRLDDASAAPMVAPSQGTHIVVDNAFLAGDTAVMVPRTDDGRLLFAIPWEGRVLIGTTDTPVRDVSVEPRPLEEEVEFLLRHAARYMARAPQRGDVKSVFAGLRPLLSPPRGLKGPTSRLSREHLVLVARSGLVTVAGGKWTTYRKMAEDTVDRAAVVAGLPRRACVTTELPLHGTGGSTLGEPFATYGADGPAARDLVSSRADWGEPLVVGLPYRLGEVAWAARHESARTVADVLARRTRALFLDARASIEAAPRVASLLANELGKDHAWVEEQVLAFESLARGYLLPDRPSARINIHLPRA